jgi:hypothetical protein
MLLKRRVGVTFACAGVVTVACLLLTQSHARATGPINYAHLNKIQKRILSETLATALGGTPSGFAQIGDQGSGADGAPNTPPSSFGASTGSGPLANYVPASTGKCSSVLSDRRLVVGL